MSPNTSRKMDFRQHTREYVEGQGWRYGSTECVTQHRKTDLFGFIDAIALDGKSIIAVQSTSYKNVSTRRRKIKQECCAAAVQWLSGNGRILILGWFYHDPRETVSWSPGPRNWIPDEHWITDI